MPSCGAQNLFRLGAPTNFDHCAILASLHHPPGVLRRRCPARACLGKDYVLPKQKDTVKVSFVLAGAEGLGLTCRLGRCFCLRQRCPPDTRTPRHAPRAERLSLFTQSKKRKHRLNRCFLFLAGAEGLEPSARGFGVVAVY